MTNVAPRPGHASPEQPIEQTETRRALLAAAEAEGPRLARLAEGEARALLDLAQVAVATARARFAAAAAMQHDGRPALLEAAHDRAVLALALILFRIVAAAPLESAPALGPAPLLLGVAAAARPLRRA